MRLSNKNPLSDLLGQGYSRKAALWIPGYAHETVLTQLLAAIDDKMKLIDGPLYEGEAERFLLDPMVGMSAMILGIDHPITASDPAYSLDVSKGYVAGGVISKAYALAASYAVISEFTKMAQIKDIANKITEDAFRKSPAYQALSTDPSGAAKSPKTRVNDKGDEVEDTSPFAQLYHFMTGTTGVVGLSQFLSLQQQSDTLNSGIQARYDDIVRFMRKGKGLYLLPEKRKEAISNRAIVRSAIQALRSKASDEKSEANIYFAESLTLAYWFLMYLKAVESYDMSFPMSPVISQSQPYVNAMRQTASRLADAFADIAATSFSFDVQVARKLYEDAKAFYQPVIVQNGAFKDQEELWNRAMTKFEKASNRMAVTAASTLFDSLKAFADADLLLAPPFQKVLADIVGSVKTSKTVTVEEVITNSSVTQAFEVLLSDSLSTWDSLYVHGASIVSAVEYLARARALLVMDYERESEYASLIPGGLEFSMIVPLKGKVGIPEVEDFARRSPLQMVYPKYAYKTTAPMTPRWTLADEMLTPKYYIPMLQEYKSVNASLIWPQIGEVPMGDPISIQFAKMPIPACYTRTRNSHMVEYTMRAFLSMTSGLIEQVPSGEVFTRVASLLARHRGEFGKPIINYLSACMFVYREGVKSTELLRPTIPTIYGAPTEAMIAKNVATPGTESYKTAVAAGLVESVVIGDEKYHFVLHTNYPKPQQVDYVATSLSRGVTLSAPVFKNVLKKKLAPFVTEKKSKVPVAFPTDAMIAAMNISDSGLTPTAWQEAVGWSQFVALLPHLLFEVNQPDTSLIASSYTKFAVTTVSTKIHPVTGDMKIAGIIDNPIEVLDMDDFNKVMSDPDPTPFDGGQSATVEEQSIRGGEEGKRAVEDHNNPRPTSPVDNNNAEAVQERASGVTGSPILHEAARDVQGEYQKGELIVDPLELMRPDDKERAAEGKGTNPAKPAAGQPGTETSHQSDAAPVDPVKKYYRLKDGSVIELDESAEVPAGAVLTTKEEYLKSKAGRAEDAGGNEN